MAKMPPKFHFKELEEPNTFEPKKQAESGEMV
jgi:hypothetical protein